jgi:putative addiction module killer protein
MRPVKLAEAIIHARIRRVSAGNFGGSKQARDAASELRVDCGVSFRAHVTQPGQEIVVPLCGGGASTQTGNDLGRMAPPYYRRSNLSYKTALRAPSAPCGKRDL